VLTLHGFAQDFARDLRARGIEAWALTGANQLELMLPGGRTPVGTELPRDAAPSPEAPGPFQTFASLTETVAESTGKLAKVRIVSDFLRELDGDNLATAATWLTGHPYPRSSQRVLQLGSALIRRALLTVSGCTPSDYQVVSRRFNDIGLTTREVLKDRVQSCTLTLEDVAADFDRLELARGPLAKQSVLEEALRRHSAKTAMAFVKILTGDLRIGLKEGLVEDAIAAAFGAEPDAVREAHMLLGDLGATALHARSGTLASVGLLPFQPVRAMLASPEPDGASIWKRFAESADDPEHVRLWIEDKFDGIRAQIHTVDGRAEIFSRDLRRITGTFPQIAAAAARIGADCVIDGEIVAFSEGRTLGFFDLQKRLGRSEPDLFLREDVPVRFVAFDLLWLRGESLFRQPLRVRRDGLDSLGLSEPLVCAEIHTATSAGEIEAEFVAARERGREGLMIKDPESAYLPGRRGIAWVKLKKAFATLDVVVVAVEYGHGRRSQVLSDYTFAVRGDQGTLLTIGKAYSGLTDAEILMLTERFLKLVRAQRGRVLEVEPVVVLEIAFDSIQRSNRHNSGFALRFPRIHRIREDKSLQEIDTLASAARLANSEST
jgi:DNA ligase-1